MKFSIQPLSLRSTRRGFLTGSISVAALGALSACSNGPAQTPTSAGTTPSGSDSASAGESSSAAPTPSAVEPVTLSLLTNNSADWDKQIQDVSKAFTAANPHITVNILNIADQTQYLTKLKTQALAGQLPDMYYARTFDLAPHVRDGWLTALDEFNTKDGDPLRRGEFYPGVEAQFSVDGKLYGVPEGLSCYGMYINKTMFEAEGVTVPTADWTWKDFFELAAKFKKEEGGRQTRWGGVVSPSSWGQIGIMMAGGGHVFNTDGSKCEMASDENVATWEAVRASVKDGGIPGSAGLPAGVDPFAGGMVAMFMNGSWYAGGAKDAIGDKFEWTILPMPKGTTGKRELATAGGGWSMSAHTKHPEEAWKFLSFLGKPETLATIPYLKSAVITARTTDTFAETNFPKVEAEDVAPILYPPIWSTYEIVYGNRYTGLYDGDDIRGTLSAIEEEINRS